MSRAPLRIIAEAAQGYEGRPPLAELLIRAAAAAKADAVKFQIVYADDVAVPAYRHYAWFRQLEMPEAAWGQLKAQARSSGLEFWCDLSGERAYAVAKAVQPDGVKIHATNFFNHRLVSQILETFPRVLISIGGMAVDEIERFIARHRLTTFSGQASFLFGFQADPTPVEQTSLARLPALMARLEGFDVGFMDHTDGDGPDTTAVSAMALALGVRLFEKHLTHDRALKLEDYASALPPERFADYVAALRRLDAALGSAGLEITEAERAYRAQAIKKVLVSRPLAVGHVIGEADLAQKRLDAPDAAWCHDPDAVIGRRLRRALEAGAPVRQEDLA